MMVAATQTPMLGVRDAIPPGVADSSLRLGRRAGSSLARLSFCFNGACGGLEIRFQVVGRPPALDAMTLPMFVVGTGRDHIAAWHSVFELHLLNHGELAFVLTSGGHNRPAATMPAS